MATLKGSLPKDTSGQEGGSPLLDRILRGISDAFADLQNAVTNDSLVHATLDNTRDWPVVHGLGTAPRTWEVVDIDANATVWRSRAVNSDARRLILLRSSAACNVVLRFT